MKNRNHTVVTDLITHVTPTPRVWKHFQPDSSYCFSLLNASSRGSLENDWMHFLHCLLLDLSVLVLTAAEGLLANMWRQYCWISMGTGAKGPAGNLGWATIEPLIRQVLTSKLLSTILIQQDVQITLSPLLRKVLQWDSKVPNLLSLKIDAGLLIKLRRQSNELQTYFWIA